MKIVSSLLLLSLLLLSSLPVYATSNAITDADPEVLIEFYDKYNEVKLGLTENSVFMEFTTQLREQMNRELAEKHNNDIESFVDSGGEFIIGHPVTLRSNTLRYTLDDIESIEFDRGKLTFEYLRKSDIGFEDIISSNGIKALSNFYVEDLEEFILTYRRLMN